MILNNLKIKKKAGRNNFFVLPLPMPKIDEFMVDFFRIREYRYPDVSDIRYSSVEIGYISKIAQIRFSGSFELSVN
jgi:hypothetical protein